MADPELLRRVNFKFTREIRELQLAELGKRLLRYNEHTCALCLKTNSTTWFPFLDQKGRFWLCERCYICLKLSTVRNCANCCNLKFRDDGFCECHFHNILIMQPYQQVCDHWCRILFPISPH